MSTALRTVASLKCGKFVPAPSTTHGLADTQYMAGHVHADGVGINPSQTAGALKLLPLLPSQKAGADLLGGMEAGISGIGRSSTHGATIRTQIV
eukprot:scaffold38413_cov17-Tisochrysis_lutea.AAC.1